MSSVPEELINLDMVTPETGDVSELISALRFRFRPANYDRVAEILVARENRMKEEIKQGKHEYVLMEKKHADAELARIVAEADVEKYKNEICQMKEQLTRLEEDSRLNLAEVRVFKDREIRTRTDVEKLVEENDKFRGQIKELGVKNVELNSAKVKAERELECVKRKNEEFELRVARLEEVFETLMRQPQVEHKVDKEGSIDANGGPLGTGSGNSSSPPAAAADTSSFKGFVIRPCDEGDSSHRNNFHKTNSTKSKNKAEIVVISDSEADMPAEDQTPNVPTVAVAESSLKGKDIKTLTSEQPGGADLCTSSKKRKRENNDGFLFSDSSSSDSDSSDGDSDSSSCGSAKVWATIQKIKGSKIKEKANDRMEEKLNE